MISAILLITTILSTTGLFFSIRKNLKYIEKFEEIDNAVRVSIDTLNDHYKSIDRKSKLEVFFDDPVVRELVHDISNSKSSIEKISKLLEDVIDDTDDDDDEMNEANDAQ